MISEERLKELINVPKPVYWVVKDEIRIMTFKSIPTYWINHWEDYSNSMFETKEEAEEYLEFGNITKTEKFPYVSWEEFNKVSSFAFESEERIMLEVAIWFNNESADDIKTIKITSLNDWNICYFEQPLTRENYHKALDLCVKLWKGK